MKLIILDRDGVINQDTDAYIKTPEEWIPLPGSLEAIARLNHAGYRIVVATNQSGIERGLFDVDTLNRIHAKMHHMLQDVGGLIDAVFFCPSADDNHPDRKPNPGLLRSIAARLGIHLAGIPVVGDSLRDIQAAHAVGARPILVRTGKGDRTLAALPDITGVRVFADLAEFSERWLVNG